MNKKITKIVLALALLACGTATVSIARGGGHRGGGGHGHGGHGGHYGHGGHHYNHGRGVGAGLGIGLGAGLGAGLLASEAYGRPDVVYVEQPPQVVTAQDDHETSKDAEIAALQERIATLEEESDNA